MGKLKQILSSTGWFTVAGIICVTNLLSCKPEKKELTVKTATPAIERYESVLDYDSNGVPRLKIGNWMTDYNVDNLQNYN